MTGRLLSLDRLRGLVMVLMTIDHASGAFNAGRLVRDSARMVEPGEALDPVQFGLRWITHLCAPTFLFLAGTALALSADRKGGVGVDRDLAIRGLLILALDPLWISRFWAGDSVLFQVMYAIGASFLFMIPLRRLPDGWLAVVGLALCIGGEALCGAFLATTGGEPALIGGLLAHGGRFDGLIVAYPVLPWLGVMILGWSFGRHLLTRRLGQPGGAARTTRDLLLAGAVSLAVFVLVRGIDGYGNMMLYRETWEPTRWLNVSKYPPSLTYVALERGIMAWILAGLSWWEARRPGRSSTQGPLLVYGQTALFFYVLHIPILELAADATGLHRSGGLGLTFAATAATLAVLYPTCRAYRAYKRAHPASWVRYL